MVESNTPICPQDKERFPDDAVLDAMCKELATYREFE
jgi:hypothetical protein